MLTSTNELAYTVLSFSCLHLFSCLTNADAGTGSSWAFYQGAIFLAHGTVSSKMFFLPFFLNFIFISATTAVLCIRGYLLPTWVLGIEPSSSDLLGKLFYSLSHLVGLAFTSLKQIIFWSILPFNNCALLSSVQTRIFLKLHHGRNKHYWVNNAIGMSIQVYFPVIIFFTSLFVCVCVCGRVSMCIHVDVFRRVHGTKGQPQASFLP